MANACKNRFDTSGHPCFGGDRRNKGRMHLPVAPACNIKCGYCVRKHDCASESRPGVTSRLLSPRQALQRVRIAMEHEDLREMISVAGIAGPGDPLANEETFETFRLLDKEFPHLIKCMSTNGLLLPDRIGDLLSVKLRSLTVTINAVDPEVGAKIYSKVNYHGRLLNGPEGAHVLIRNQLAGLDLAARNGIMTKVNTVLIPGVNDDQIPRIARAVKERDALLMNIMPVIPQADFASFEPPTVEQLQQVRDENEGIIVQFRHCSQCRADAVGLIGKDTAGGCRR